MLGAIAAGTQLRSVEHVEKPAPADGRGGLLAQIARGTTLKKVKTNEESDDAPSSSGGGGGGLDGLAGALQKALATRSNAVHGGNEQYDSLFIQISFLNTHSI